MSYKILNSKTEKPFLEDKVSIVTGASGDIGSEICKTLLDHGAYVNAFYNKGKEKIDELAKEYEKVRGFQIDFLSDNCGEKIQQSVREIRRKYKKLDILINVAGIWIHTPFLYETEEQHKKIWKINYEAPYLFSREVIRYMMGPPGTKHIINIASTAGVRGTAQQISYSNSKAALVNLSEALAEEFGGYGINVNSISPGLVKTQAIRPYITDGKVEKLAAKSIVKYALCKTEDVSIETLGILMGNYRNGANVLLHGGRL